MEASGSELKSKTFQLRLKFANHPKKMICLATWLVHWKVQTSIFCRLIHRDLSEQLLGHLWPQKQSLAPILCSVVEPSLNNLNSVILFEQSYLVSLHNRYWELAVVFRSTDIQKVAEAYPEQLGSKKWISVLSIYVKPS